MPRYHDPGIFIRQSFAGLLNYRYFLTDPAFFHAMGNSLKLVFAVLVTGTIIIVAAVISWVVVRTKIPGRWLLDSLASMPLVFPGIVLGLSIMICYLYIDIGIYNTIWIMLVAYVTRFLPYGMRYSSTSMLQIHK